MNCLAWIIFIFIIEFKLASFNKLAKEQEEEKDDEKTSIFENSIFKSTSFCNPNPNKLTMYEIPFTVSSSPIFTLFAIPTPPTFYCIFIHCIELVPQVIVVHAAIIIDYS